MGRIVWDPDTKGWVSTEPSKAVTPAQKLRRKLSWPKRYRIYVRDRWTCRQCGTISEELTIDHVVPLSKGGTNDPANLQVLCRPCNRDKADKL